MFKGKPIGKIAAGLGALIFLLGILAGCGGGTKSQEAPKQEGGSQKKVVKIAFIGPLTGPNATEGVGPRNTFELAVNQANKSGKLPFEIKFLAYDDASNPGTAASVAQKIVAEPDVVAASGHWNTACAEATIPIFKAAGIPMVIWGAIGPSLTKEENFPYITRVCPTSVQENIPLAAFVMDQLGRKKWALISSTSVYGKANTEAWQAEVKKRSGAEIVSLDEITDGSTDFRPILSKIKKLNVDGLYYGGNIMEAALIRSQMNELGMKDILMAGISGIVSPKFIEVAGQAAEGVVVTQPGKEPKKMPGGKEFIEEYQKAGYKEPYGAYGAYAYDAANIIITALKEAGTDRKALADKIGKIAYTGLLGTTSFDKTGQTTNSLSTIYVIQDGKFVDWDESKYKTGERKLPGAK
ncbi:MAG: branched-chain amino acid transport system substrate-binding protein [Clostridia bacterium]|nr:branched-chain amino acid transport system substrate-binding protein [Clostridia bacterium]